MYEIGLKYFRGFHDVDFIGIRPITLLIGENSAGKTSFLAAIKYMFDFIRNEGDVSFNSEPFQLGTFEQISHYRGGKAGRAKQFEISIRTFIEQSKRDSDRISGNVTFKLLFRNLDSQSAISEFIVSAKQEAITIKFDGDNLSIVYSSPKGEAYQVEDLREFTRDTRSEFGRYWQFIMRDLRYRIRRSVDAGQPSLFGQSVAEERVSVLAEVADTFARRLSGHVEATSAIRTKPLRTYTPAGDKRDGEGSHVPFEMAKLYRSRSKDSWKNLKGAIERYGSTSEMFKEVDIKSFGKTASDPFQIQFSSDGPKTNIVDLGYGTSQVLPILYDIATAPKRSKFLIQQPEVHLHPKAQAALGSYFIDSFIKDRKEFVLETHSDFIVDRVRQAIAAGFLQKEDVSILFFERQRLENSITQIELDDSGNPINPPDNYRSFFLDEQMKNLGV